jgi:hypothetical protein
MKKVCWVVCMFVICMSGNSWAGMVTDIWTDVYNSGQDHYDSVNGNPTKMFDNVSEVAIDSAGNVIAAGRKAGTANYGINAYARKYDSQGNFVCQIEVDSGIINGTGGVASSDVFYSVAVDSQDNIILAGTISGVYAPAHQKMYLNKYDSNCSPVWGQPIIYIYNPGCYGCSAWQSLSDIAVDKTTDDIYVSGTVFGAWDNVTEQEWAIFKYDQDGVLQAGFPWIYNYGTDHYIADLAYGIALDNEGNIIVVGQRGVSGTDGGLTNNIDWHVRKYSPTGSLIWEDSYDATTHLADVAYKVAVDANDDVIVAGYTNIGTNNSTNANYDWLVIKYSRDGDSGVGQRLWTHRYESATGSSEACYAIALNDSGDAWVSGNYLNTSEVPAVSNKRLALIRGTDGAFLGEKLWTAANTQTMLAVAAQDDVVATGSNLYDGTYYDFETTVFSSATFSDVAWDFWAVDYIRSMSYYGITTGYSDGTYRPSQNVQRSQMAAFIIRATFGEDFSYSPTPHFTDVLSGHWAFKYVQKMYDEGITTGYADGTYRPSQNVQRSQMASFIIKALYPGGFTYTLTPFFSDVLESHWAFQYVQKMYDDGITTGYADGTYRPSQDVSRAQMATFIGRAFLGME